MTSTERPSEKSALTWAPQLEATVWNISRHARWSASAAQEMLRKIECLDSRPNFEMRCRADLRAAEQALSLAMDDVRAAMAKFDALPLGKSYVEGASYLEAAE